LPSGYGDLTGLDEPVEDDELAGLFKPSVMAVYDQEKARKNIIDKKDEDDAKKRKWSKWKDMFFANLHVLGLAALPLAFWLLRRVKYQLFDDGLTLEIKGKSYQIHQRSGVVVDKVKSHETIIETSVGGSQVYPTSVYVAPPTITSRTVTHDAILVKDSEGNERTIRLKNWDITAWTGNNVCFIWFSCNGKESDDYVAYYNLSTNDRAVNMNYLRGLLAPTFAGLALLLVVLSTTLTSYVLGWNGVVVGLIGVAFIFHSKSQAKLEAEKIAVWLQKNVRATNQSNLQRPVSQPT
jgi:hypothetical protein